MDLRLRTTYLNASTLTKMVRSVVTSSVTLTRKCNSDDEKAFPGVFHGNVCVEIEGRGDSEVLSLGPVGNVPVALSCAKSGFTTRAVSNMGLGRTSTVDAMKADKVRGGGSMGPTVFADGMTSLHACDDIMDPNVGTGTSREEIVVESEPDATDQSKNPITRKLVQEVSRRKPR